MKQKTYLLLSSLLLFCFLGVTVFNTVELFLDLKKNQRIRRVIPFIFLGFKFSGLDQFFKDEKYVGYYSDGDAKDANVIEEYSQAQYVLAPIILDLNNTSHRYTIFNCTSDAVAMKKIQELGLRPFKRNNLGIIISRNW